MQGLGSSGHPAWTATVRASLVAFLVASIAVPGGASAQPLPSTTPDRVELSTDRLTRIGRALDSEVAKGATPGAVVLVARKGKVAYFEAFGSLDKAKGVPMPRDAIFRIYSMTKPFVSVATLMLAEEGTIQLTDPVSKWLPAFKSMQVAVTKVDPLSGRVTTSSVPADRPMTIHDLLRHTSGLIYPGFTANDAVKESYVKAGLGPEVDKEALSPAEFTERMSKVLLAHQPGMVWEYGLSHDLLGRVVEAASGKRLGDFLAERVFGPLAMADTGFSVSIGKKGRLAQPLPADPATGKPIEMLDVLRVPSNDMGGEGAVSTAADYLRFCQMLLEGGRLGNVRLLSRTSVALLASDHLGSRPTVPFTPGDVIGPGILGYGYGLGVGVRLTAGMASVPGSVGEYFWTGYGGTFFWIDPAEQLVAVYMAQAPGRAAPQPRRILKQVVTQAIAD